jgi:hypothetical protein
VCIGVNIFLVVRNIHGGDGSIGPPVSKCCSTDWFHVIPLVVLVLLVIDPLIPRWVSSLDPMLQLLSDVLTIDGYIG